MNEAIRAEYKALEDAVQILSTAFGECGNGAFAVADMVLHARGYLKAHADTLVASVMEVV